MSRTHKDINPKYLQHNTDDKQIQKVEPQLKRSYLNLRKYGPPLDGEICPECGGLTDFQSGYLTCCECGWTEDAAELFEMERFSA